LSQSSIRSQSLIREVPEVPLNEETESYLIQVKAEGQLKRELMVVTSVWDYTVAMRADDGVVGACAV